MSQSGIRFLTKYTPRLVLLDPGLHKIARLLFVIQLSIILYIDASWKLRKRAVTETGVLYCPNAFRIIVLVSYDEAGHMSRVEWLPRRRSSNSCKLLETHSYLTNCPKIS